MYFKLKGRGDKTKGKMSSDGRKMTGEFQGEPWKYDWIQLRIIRKCRVTISD